MKQLLIALLSLMLAIGLKGQDVAGQQPRVDSMEPDFLDFWFSSVQIDHGILVMKRGSEDLSFMFQKVAATPVTSPPGSVVQLPLGVPGRVFNTQSDLKFIPFPGRSGRNLFLLEETNRIGDIHVGLLRATSKPTGTHSVEVLPVDTREGLEILETQVKDGTFTYSAK